MIPLFDGPEKKRRINLGGTSAALSHAELLSAAKAVRTERLEQRRREDAALRMQAIWRARQARRGVRRDLEGIFDEEGDEDGIRAMRALVLLGDDEARLGIWSGRVDERRQAELATGLQKDSWLVLVCQLAAHLLRSVANNPSSKYATTHLKVINTLLDPAFAQSHHIARYLLWHGYYFELRLATEAIPIEAKSTSPLLPLLVPLFTAPFALSGDVDTTVLFEVTFHILTLPLLPNRLPINELMSFSARLPLHALHSLAPYIEQLLKDMPVQDKCNLLANFSALMPARYKVLSPESMETYLKIMATLLEDIPQAAFEDSAAETPTTSWAQAHSSDDEDDEDEKMLSGPIAGPSHSQLRMELDSRTRKRLRDLGAPKHIAALIAACGSTTRGRMTLYGALMALYAAWPAARADVLAEVLAGLGGSGIVRELYRGHVRSSGLGRKGEDVWGVLGIKEMGDGDGEAMDDGEGERRGDNGWIPLLFLTDLYTQALLTMGDDEFFASRMNVPGSGARAGAGAENVHRNPLTVDEVVEFSSKLMNIAFALYWDEAAIIDGVSEGGSGKWAGVGPPGTPVGWGAVREKTTVLLQAVHARDSRRPFTPPDHWLCSSQFDMNAFIEAAINEDESLDTSTPPPPPSRRRFGAMRAKIPSASSLSHLGILHSLPFAIPFATRVSIFRKFVERDKMAFAGGTSRYSSFQRLTSREQVTVRRGNVAVDGFDKLGNSNLKGSIYITFVDQFGRAEAGIDGGGVFKEFFTELCKEVFDTDRGLWLATKQNELYPNPHSYAKEPHSLDWYRFIGRILGKALYEGILVDVAFAGFFLAKWLGKQSYLDDLRSLDAELYNGLLFLKNFDGKVEDLSLTFAVTEEEFGAAQTISLVKGGANVPVTRQNRLQYIYLMCHYHLTKKIKLQTEAFFEGLSEMIQPKWIQMFNQQELQILIGGVNAPIDLDDLRKHTVYGGSFKDDSPIIEAFWQIVNSFDHEQRRLLLRFATSCSRPPLLGFKELRPNFSVRSSGEDQNRLPTASTCVNLLKLPSYTDQRVMKAKILQAITSGAGFDLS